MLISEVFLPNNGLFTIISEGASPAELKPLLLMWSVNDRWDTTIVEALALGAFDTNIVEPFALDVVSK